MDTVLINYVGFWYLLNNYSINVLFSISAWKRDLLKHNIQINAHGFM